MKSRTAARLLAAPAAAALLTLSLAGPASAHVTVTPKDPAAGAFTVLTVSVPHGCDGSATTKVAIQIPQDILSVTPTRNAYYDVSKKMEKLTTPVKDSHGNEVTERVASVEYTARTPLPDGQRDAFELSLQLPDAAGETLTFPSIQTCQKGETAWTEVPAEGQDEEELEHPAPAFEVTEAEEGEGHDDAADDSHQDGEEQAASAETQNAASDTDDADDGGTGATLGIIGLVLGALGLAAGGTALVQVRRKA
jgi:uncharacterized protein YcnI